MKVFISWSGERSKAVAQALRDWLPNVIQAVEPWMSEADIAKGARWTLDMARELDETRVGIICLTPENLNAPWILFEAGALSKKRFAEASYVCTYLFDVVPAEAEEPWAQFQHTIANKEDTKRLLQTINNQVLDDDEALSEERLNRAFEKWWPELEGVLTSVPAVEEKPELQRSVPDMVEEILALVRALDREMVLQRSTLEQATGIFTWSSESLNADAYVHRAIPTSAPTTTTTVADEGPVVGRARQETTQRRGDE